VRGDHVSVYAYDDEGNVQYLPSQTTKTIIAGLNAGRVRGYWDSSPVRLDVTLKDTSGNVKGTKSTWIGLSQDHYSNSFSTSMASLSPGDRIEIKASDNAYVEAMTVQNLSTRLRGDVGQLAGAAPAGRLLSQPATYDVQRREYLYRADTCLQGEVPGGAFHFTFPGGQVRGGDYANTFFTGGDGHYTASTGARGFQVNLSPRAPASSGAGITGYTEVPNSIVTLHSLLGGSESTVQPQADSSGYYEADLSQGGAPQTGNYLEVTTSDGESLYWPLPVATFASDAATNSVNGAAPAGGTVAAYLYQRGASDSTASTRSLVAVGPGGAYSAPFNGLLCEYYDSQTSASACIPADVGDACSRPSVRYYASSGHTYYVQGSAPGPPDADSFEFDNAPSSSRSYIALQRHTLTPSDEDWIRFEVSAADWSDGARYRLSTGNLGLGASQVVELYAGDGITLLQRWVVTSARGEGILVIWSAPEPGTYYVRVTKGCPSCSSFGGDTYDLMIMPLRAMIYLPLVRR